MSKAFADGHLNLDAEVIRSMLFGRAEAESDNLIDRMHQPL